MKKQYVTHFDKNTKHGVILISPRVDKQKNKIPPQISKLEQKPIYHTNIINRPQETIVLNKCEHTRTKIYNNKNRAIFKIIKN